MSGDLDGLILARARDLEGRSAELWVRRLLALVLAALPVVALFNVFGQRASEASASSPAVKLTVQSPTHLRAGLLYEVRFTIEARQDLKNATLELGAGWANGLTINSIEPQPSDETSSHGELSLSLGDISAGDTYVLHVEYQVNPTTIGSRHQPVALMDGPSMLVSLDRELRVYP